MKKLDIYHFGDGGTYDEYNPFYVFEKTKAIEIVYLIASNEPYTIDKSIIQKKLKMSWETCIETLNSLEKIKAIERKNDKYKVNFTIILEKDIDIIDKFSKALAERLGDKIIGLEERINDKLSELKDYGVFPNSRLLYHILGADIFDGIAFDYFGERDLFAVSKKQPDNRDYILVGYENSDKVRKYSKKLLCSHNGYTIDNFKFGSFGDCDGDRRDMYRFFRKVESSIGKATNYEKLNVSYNKLNYNHNVMIMRDCFKLFTKILVDKVSITDLSNNEKLIADFLNELDYINIDKKSHIITRKVPTFRGNDNKVIEEIAQLVLSEIYEDIKVAFNNIHNELITLTPVKHGIDIKEVANELWHQIFGSINEYFIIKEFFEKPFYNEGEGRYLRCVNICD
ncbi:hypothetical protein [Dethiothermospora halolimnae]|uniref:hypothetical protein n=1 Tax=Dethiothermospora halolimnae TaxID=3114390 RepID=UPI003CCBEE28